NPLALYVISTNKATIEKVASETDSGGFYANDFLVNMTISGLPFGGVGASGTGKYHGRHGFESYTHKRSVLLRSPGMEAAVAFRYPP
ncbi:Aldehyde/histidinol dehydrogenase, partial [Blyttiomyces helicus]